MIIEFVWRFQGYVLLIWDDIDIGLMDYYLGLEMKQMENDIFVSQESYGKVLKKFQKFDYNFLNTPMEGNLILSRLDGGNKEDPNSWILDKKYTNH